MQIRKAKPEDLNAVLKVYEKARAFMKDTGNPTQWAGGYPEESLLREDIRQKRLFVVENQKHIAAAFYTVGGIDPTYVEIEGEWLNDRPYGVIHRIASDGSIHGILPLCVNFCKQFYSEIRIDTHEDNKVMQHLLTKYGFKRCGIIHIADGSPRIAYQFSKEIKPHKELERYQQIERSIVKRFRKTIWNNFISAVKEYDMIQAGDCIAVCISGGKDSMLLAKCMQQLCRFSEVPFTVKFLVMDPGYADANRRLLEENSKILGFEPEIFDNNIFNVVHDAGGSPCYLCARMRRGALYDKARSIGCNKIALGHHLDDVIETVLMSMMYSSEIKTMLPKLHSTNFEGMELIRPLYKVKERDIIAWAKYNGLKFLQCACRFTEESEKHEDLSKRREIKELIKTLRLKNPEVDNNIFRAIHNVNLATIPGWRDRDEGELHSFLENY